MDKYLRSTSSDSLDMDATMGESLVSKTVAPPGSTQPPRSDTNKWVS